MGEDSWEKLFKQYQILQAIDNQGSFSIKAKQIKEYREPRLMTKYDHEDELPDIFQKHKLSILPLSRFDFIISHFSVYKKVPSLTGPIVRFRKPANPSSFDINNITTEKQALIAADLSGITEDFLQDASIREGDSSRESSKAFDFFIKNTKEHGYNKISVKNAQIEIDRSYEGEKSLYIFEAKKTVNDTFLVRQLYYPYRTFNIISGGNKDIKLVYFIYANKIFYFFEFKVAQMEYYNSLQLIKKKIYTFEDAEISRPIIEDYLDRTEPVKEPEIPFPQADNFQRVIELTETLCGGNGLGGDDIAEKCQFVLRQSGYYGNAGLYLGLFEKDPESYKFIASEEGQRICHLPYTEKQLAFAEVILSHSVFRKVMKAYFIAGEMPSKACVINIMKESGLYNVGKESTFFRRASTVTSWIKWIVNLFGN